MSRNKDTERILAYFRQEMPQAQTELNFDSPFHLLVAVILSAQCTDKRVNLTTPAIFERFATPESLAESDFDTVFPLVKSISYPNSKTRHLLEMSKMLVEKFNSTVPSDIDELMSLPGVGRKTANVIASIIYDKPVIAVDTHVMRVSHRLGLSSGKTPEAVEKDLEKLIQEKERAIAHHWLILHGRYVCTARAPHCDKCGLNPYCNFILSSSLD